MGQAVTGTGRQECGAAPPWRRAARVILLATDGTVLLASSHDPDDPDRRWWFTPGGGVEGTESQRAAAVRELREETGIVLPEADLVGPVATRSALLDFAAQTLRQEEVYFLATIDRTGVELVRHDWTDQEAASLDCFAWLSRAELDAVDVEVFPPQLPSLLQWLRDGWDGERRVLR